MDSEVDQFMGGMSGMSGVKMRGKASSFIEDRGRTVVRWHNA